MAKPVYKRLLSGMAEANRGFRLSTRHHLAYTIRNALVLSGYLLDLSGLEQGAFYLTAFAQPLYVPHNFLFLTYGKRLSHGKRWKITTENESSVIAQVLKAASTEGKTVLDTVNSVENLAATTEARSGTKENPFGWHETDPNMLECRGYSWALAGDSKRARRDLLYLTETFVPTYPWEKEIQARSAVLLSALEKNADSAKTILVDWAKQTALNLKLDASPTE